MKSLNVITKSEFKKMCFQISWHDNGGSITATPSFSEVFGVCFCKIRIYLNCNVNNMCFIVYFHYKNTSIRLCEEYKRSLTIRILRCRDQGRTKFWIFLSVTVWGFILFRYYYKFYIAANPSSLGVFLHICIVCRYFYK